MQRPSIRSLGGKERLSRGVSPSSKRVAADEAAFLDGVDAEEKLISHLESDHRENVNPRKSLKDIAVVVGSKKPLVRDSKPMVREPAARRPMTPEPMAREPMTREPMTREPMTRPPMIRAPMTREPMTRASKPAAREPNPVVREARPAFARAPALPARVSETTPVTTRRTAANAVPVLRDRRPEASEADQDGLKSYLVRSFETQRRSGGRVLALALIVGGGWGTLVPLSGAVVVPGTVVAESSVKKIQHQTGGIVSAISVTDGMSVHAGDVLVRLDDTKARTDYEQMRSKISQLNEEIGGIDAQIKSRQTQSDLIAQELQGVQALWDKRLTPLTRLTSLQREAARIDGEKAQLVSSLAETRGKIKEGELELAAAKNQLDHVELRAPVSGIVHQLAIHTVGGVVTPAEVMMVIVPEADELQIDAHLPPEQIDQVHKGQSAQIHFPAFNQRTTPGLTGVVTHVSADITRDPQQPSNSPGYYTVRVSLPPDQTARLGGDHPLIAGMPAELFIQTGSRTMMSYMFKPITEQLARMFRER